MHELIAKIAALGLARPVLTQSVANKVLLNTPQTLEIRPVAPYKFGLIYDIQYPIPLPEDVGQPISSEGSGTFSSSTYASLTSITVNANRSFSLQEASMDSTNYTQARFRLAVDSTNLFNNITISSALSQQFARNQIPEDSVIRISGMSNDNATSITSYGSLSGKEFPTHVFSLLVRLGSFIPAHTVLTTSDVIKNRTEMWAPFRDSDPLVIVVTNVNGYGGERFVVTVKMLVMETVSDFYQMQNTISNYLGKELGLTLPEPIRSFR